jgi:hypothetical protein
MNWVDLNICCATNFWSDETAAGWEITLSFCNIYNPSMELAPAARLGVLLHGSHKYHAATGWVYTPSKRVHAVTT